jgi:hypothetical protein
MRSGVHKPNEKLSLQFRLRLNSLDQHERVHAIVILDHDENNADDGSGVEPKSRPRHSRADRSAAVETIREKAKAALPEVDRILEQFEGRRLSDEVTSLGTILVEATPSGISALAMSERVKAILEDQSISALR